MHFKTTLLACLIALLASCGNNQQTAVEETPTSPPEIKEHQSKLLPVVEELETSHNVKNFQERAAIAFDIELYFRGKKRLEGRIFSSTNSDRIRLDRTDGVQVIFDGEKVVMSPANTEYQGARFGIFTWQYFFMAPFKLSDPGTKWEALSGQTINGVEYSRGKLTFDSGVGDAPDDWYIAYKNKTTGLMDILAYIVTYSKSQEKAEEEPHAISYHQYEPVDGIPIAKEWKFWLWTEEKGIFDQLGEAKITNVEFLDDITNVFELPKDYVQVDKE